MSPRTAIQLEELRQQKRTLILDTALSLFAHRGYYSTTMSEVATAARIAKGSIYSYFTSKEELLRSILLLGLSALEDFARQFPQNRPVPETLAWVVDYQLNLMRTEGAFWKLYFSLVMQVDVMAMIGPDIAERGMPILERIAEVFARQGSPDPLAEALLFSHLMDGIGVNYLMNPEYTDLDKMREMILRRFA